MKAAVLALAGFLMVAAVDVDAAEDPRDWLADMNRAFNEVDYDGVFSFFNGSELASLRIVHMLVDGVPHERLIHQNGAPREIVRRGEEVVCILMPGDDLLDLESDRPAGPFARTFVRRYDNLSEYYSLTFYGEDAGIKAMRKHLDGYLAQVPGATQLRNRLIRETDQTALFAGIAELGELDQSERMAA